MDLPATVFILALVPEGGPSEARMVIYGLDRPDGRVTPVFSSIRTAADFLTRAQQLGQTVPFDYIFRADAARLASDFPEYRPVLDPTADTLF
jgi:hypothetical protein